MFAKVLRLRQMGVLIKGPLPPDADWASGILETTATQHRGSSGSRRLVLRHAMASPDMGLIFELYQPALIEATSTHLRLRGIEAVTLGQGQVGGMVQEWLVQIRG
jgi:hypothetical protein